LGGDKTMFEGDKVVSQVDDDPDVVAD